MKLLNADFYNKRSVKILGNFTLFYLLFLSTFTTKAQDVILQAFYWNSHPGDLSELSNGGIWWDTIALTAPQIGAAGFETVWTPPPTKSFAGKFDMGYGPYDYFDLGEFNSKGTVRTRHGSRAELEAMINALHSNGVKVMADVVLNHRAGGDATAQEEAGPDIRFLIFNPPSGRLPSGPEDFHPNNFHADENGPFHDAIFFEDVCYFNNVTSVPPTNADGTPGVYYFGAPTTIGEMGVDLIGWGRFLKSVGFDDIRLDAVKHIEPDYLAKFIIEINDGTQPFALGEFFDFNPGAIVGYHSSVEGSSNTGGIKGADMSMFDFPLRGALQGILNDGAGNADLYNALGGVGLVWGSTLSGDDVVTWLDTHDTDRTGYVEDSEGCDIPFGGSCLKFETEPDHNPIFQDKEDMGYPFLMASEGRPIVFWKDYFWFDLDEDIKWQMALRAATASGGSDHIQNLGGFWPTNPPYDGDNHGGNMFAMRRDGLTGGVSDGLVLGLNDHPFKTNAVFVNTPFAEKYLKDYSDGFLFETTQAFADSRALIKAKPRDYSWYAPTGLYPQSPNALGSHFSMETSPGGCPHFVAIRVEDANSFLVNGASIDLGDEIAVKNADGQVVGIGRIGQRFQWDGVHDMIIEALGAPSTNGLNDGETLRVFVYDASSGQELEAGSLVYAGNNTVFDFDPDRPNSPNRNGNFPTISLTTNAQGDFECAGIALLTGFDTDLCSITDIAAGQQFACDAANNTYNQEVIVSYLNPPVGASLVVNGQSFLVTGSPQTVLLEQLLADGAPVSVTASFSTGGCDLTVAGVFVAPPACDVFLDCGTSNASAAVYDDGWQGGDNDGSGFGPWNLFTQNNNLSTGGHFVFTSTDNGDGDSNGDGDIDSAGEAWGLYANSGDVSNAVRLFSSSLETDGSFSLEMDNGWIDNGGTVGFGLQNAGGENLFEFLFIGGASTYEYVDAGGLQSIPGMFFTDEGLSFSFQLTSLTTYEATIHRKEDGSNFNISGSLSPVGGSSAISQLRTFNANAGGGGQRNLYFNNLELCTPIDCAITAISAGNQTACESATNTYTQEVTVTYELPPTIGQLVVNGQFFPITASPQTIVLTDLNADGQAVDVTASFSATPACSMTAFSLFTAPQACPPCVIQNLFPAAQSPCASATNEYTQDIIVVYQNAPAAGNLIVNGQSFSITGSPQTITLTGLDSDGLPVDVMASFSEDVNCQLMATALFTAPEACPPCVINAVTAGAQSTCLALTNTYTQEVIVTYENAPDNGFLVANDQFFPIEGSPQTLILAGLPSDGSAVDVSVYFSDSVYPCTFNVQGLFTAPTSCLAGSACDGDAANDPVYDDGWASGDNGGTGFGPWQLNTQNNNPSTGGHFVFTSTDNGDGDANGDGDIDSAGEAWGMYANSGDVSEAIRPFSDPLTANSLLNFGFDNGFIDAGGTVGFGLQNASGENLMEFFFIGGNATYIVNDASGANATGIGFTDEGLSISITNRGASIYELIVTQLNGGFTQAFSGTFFNPGGGQVPERIRFFNANAGFNAPANVFINNLEICSLSCDISITEVLPSCPGGATGGLSLMVNSNALPITYSITGSSDVVLNSNTFSASDLSADDYTITATDANGCTSSVEVTIPEADNSPPTIVCPADITSGSDAGECGAIIDFMATATDNCSATISYSQEPGTFFEVGTTEVTATVTDVGGNETSCTFDVTVMDTEIPFISCPADLNVGVAFGQCSAAVFYEATAIDNCGATISYDIAPGSIFEVGTTQVQATATDEAGFSASCTFNVMVSDIEAPVVTCPADLTVNTDPGQCNAIIDFAVSASDNCETNIAYSHAPNSVFPVGSTTVEVTVSDNAGNTSSCSFIVEVTDEEPPSISCPADISANSLPNECGANISWTIPSAADNCGILSVSSLINPGDFFDVGATTVLYTAIDVSGNKSVCTFDVTVIDATPPVVIAELIPIDGDDDDDDEGENDDDDDEEENDDGGDYEVSCSAMDNCDDNPEVLSVIETPVLINPTIDFKVKNKKKLDFKLNQNKITVEAPDPQGFWATIQLQGGVEVSEGQVLEIKENSQKYQFKFTNSGALKSVKGPNVILRCTATDESGNQSSASDSVIFGTDDDDFGGGNAPNNGPSAILEFESSLGLELFPNPTKNEVFLGLEKFLEDEITIVCYNYLGQTVYLQRVESAPSKLRISLSDPHFGKGVYLFAVIHENKRYTQRLIIVE